MQAVLITAYHNYSQLERLADVLSTKFEVFIHIDKRAEKYTPSSINKRIHVYSEFPVNWGGVNHLKSIMFLMEQAIRIPDISYCHLISGDDWPVRGLSEIYNYYENSDEIAILCTKLKEMDEDWLKICDKFQKYYSYMDCFDYKKLPQKVIVKCFVLLQQIMRIDRTKKLNLDLAQGLVWGSYPRDAILYCLDYNSKHPEFLVFLSKGKFSEEFFFHTLLANNYEFKNRISKNNHRYMNWHKKYGAYPAILDMDDYPVIMKGDYFFCRKIDDSISRELIKALSGIVSK